MSHTRKPWGLLRKIVPERSAERVPDPADMGTAFGLDFCLADRDASLIDAAPDTIEGPDALLKRLFAAPRR